jgi:hypothetical protein
LVVQTLDSCIRDDGGTAYTDSSGNLIFSSERQFEVESNLDDRFSAFEIVGSSFGRPLPPPKSASMVNLQREMADKCAYLTPTSLF